MSIFSSIGNILGAVAAPFTGGASLLPSPDWGGASIVGGLLQNNSAKSLAQSSNAQAIELANTQHQREVRDLQAAGLNPILSAGGNGAAVPSMQTPSVGNVLGSAVGSAMQAQLSKAQIEQVKSQTAQTNASTELTKQQLEDLKRYGGPAQSGIFPSAIGTIRRSVERMPPVEELPALAHSLLSSARSAVNDRLRGVAHGSAGAHAFDRFESFANDVKSAAGRGMSSARAAVPERFLRLLESLK